MPNTALAAALLACAFPATALAQDGSLHAGQLEVPLNKSQVVSADRPIARAMVGNPEIADVLPISERSVYVLGKKFGTTSLTLYDRLSRVIAVMDIAVGPDVVALRSQLGQLVPNQTIDVRISNESVILSGMVNNAGAADRAVQIARSYAGDKVINLIAMGGSQQVMLEVRFAEVTRNNNKDLGVRSTARSKDGTFGGVAGTGSQFAPGLTSSNSSTSNGSTATSSNNSSSTGTNSTTNNSANGTFSNSSNNGSNFTTNGTTNSTANGTNLGLNGQTGLTGSAAEFNNLGTLANQTFTGTGQAGAIGTTSSGTSGASGTSLAGSTGSGTSSSSGGNSVTGVVGAVVTAMGGTALSSIASSTTSLASLLQVGSIGDGFGIFRKQFSIGNVAIESVLNAMESRGLAKTLAEPTLIALSGEKASFLAGGEFPIPVAQSGNGGGNAITVEFKPFGVSLSFTPTVLGDGVINLVVEPEVSSIDPSASISIGGLVVPGLRTRRASTTMEVRDGESFAIAGLLQRDFNTTVRQLPGLGSIPILGALFRSSSFQKGETELLIVVTPRLVKPVRPDQIRLPTDRIADPRGVDLLLDGEGYHPKALPPQSKASGGAAFEGAFPRGGQEGPAPVASVGELPAAAQAPSGPRAKDSDYAF